MALFLTGAVSFLGEFVNHKAEQKCPADGVYNYNAEACETYAKDSAAGVVI
jgi:hypothetical protein